MADSSSSPVWPWIVGIGVVGAAVLYVMRDEIKSPPGGAARAATVPHFMDGHATPFSVMVIDKKDPSQHWTDVPAETLDEARRFASETRKEYSDHVVYITHNGETVQTYKPKGRAKAKPKKGKR